MHQRAFEISTVNEVYTRPKSKPVFDKIRADIVEGKYHTGQWLKQAELESRYKASRSEVRAALSTLAERGMVEYIKNRGFRIFSRSQEELDEMTEMLEVLEVAAVPAMVRNATPKAIASLREIAKRFDAGISNSSPAQLRLINYEFHQKLNELCSNRLIASNIQSLRESFISTPFDRYMTYDGLKAASAEHLEIVSLLEQGDEAALRRLIKAHVGNV